MPRPSARLAAAFALLLSACATSAGSKAPSGARLTGCPRCSAAAPIGALASGAVDECSGAVFGATHPDVLYIHSDSGDAARFFAIGKNGTPRGEFAVRGATAIDWEDVARGPCPLPGGSCLFFADLGDNDKKRSNYVIYRAQEPSELDQERGEVTADVIPVSYPDGSRNAETLLVHPVTGVITIVTKVKKGNSRVYELAPGGPATLRERGKIAPPVGDDRFTGGNVRPDGLGVLLRTYTNVFFYPMTPGQTVAEALASDPCALPAAGDEEQGEAITWVPGSWDYVSIGEGAKAKINRVSCQAP
jgi:hypothetical protein